MSASSAASYEQFVDYVAEGLRLDPLALVREARLDDDLGLDSFDMVEVIVRIEELGVRFRDEDVMSVQTVGDLYEQYTRKADRSGPRP